MAGEMSIITPSFGSSSAERRIIVSASALNLSSFGRSLSPGGMPWSWYTPLALRSAAVIANGATWPQNGVRWRCVDSLIGRPNWSMRLPRKWSGCQRFGSFIVVPGISNVSGGLTGAKPGGFA